MAAQQTSTPSMQEAMIADAAAAPSPVTAIDSVPLPGSTEAMVTNDSLSQGYEAAEMDGDLDEDLTCWTCGSPDHLAWQCTGSSMTSSSHALPAAPGSQVRSHC